MYRDLSDLHFFGKQKINAMNSFNRIAKVVLKPTKYLSEFIRLNGLMNCNQSLKTDKTMFITKSNFIKMGFFLFLCISIGACQSDVKKKSENALDSISSQPKDTLTDAYLLIPGKQFGKIKINSNADEVLADFPKPDFGDAGMGKVLIKWNDIEGDSLFMFNTQKMGVEDFKRIKIIRSFSGKYKTKEGIGVGSSLTDIQKHFQLENRGTAIENSESYTIYTDVKGIGFEVDSNQICQAILVFPEGYMNLPFYPNLQSESD